MTAHNVRKATVQFVTSQLDGARPPLEPATSDLKASTMSLPNFSSEQSEALGDSVMSEIPPPTEIVPMDPLYIHSQRDLEDAFREMQPHFEGRETEHNWIPRDKSVTKLRRLTSGNAPTDFHVAFLIGIKSLIDGINKVANSLRTTMSTNGCQLVQELAKVLGTSFDPMTDFFLPGFIKMSGATKHISQQNGSVTADTILANVSFHMRSMQQVWSAYQEKNVSIRMYATGWLKTLIKKHGSKPHFEGSLELVEKCLRKGLADANPKVKEGTRSTYWTYAKCWPAKAEAFMASLEGRTKQFMERDSANPNGSLASSQSSATTDGNRPLTAASGRASVRDTIMAQRRAMKAAANIERPSSAQSVLSPATRGGPSTLRHAVSTANVKPGTSNARPQATSTASTNSAGGLMSAPLRRPRRPELTRPATADPYARANRAARGANQTTPLMSPAASPEKNSTVKRSPGKTTRTPATRIPVSPPRSKSRVEQLGGAGRARAPSLEPRSSPSRGDDLTYVVPFSQHPDDDTVMSASGKPRRAGMDKTMSVDSGIAGLTGTPTTDDDGTFTMVLPNLHTADASKRSPSKIPSPRPSPRSAISERASPGKSPKSHLPRSSLPHRQLFPPKDETPQDEEVRVYEDPFVADDHTSRTTSSEKPVLEELPLNERNVEREHRLVSEGSTASSNDRPGESPLRPPVKPNGDVTHDRAETLRSRRLLSSGIERVKACTLDAHGFRRLQDLVKQGNPDIWYTEVSIDSNGSTPQARPNKFAELMAALLDYLATPLDPTKFPSSKAQNLKTQALATIRAMLTLWKKEGERFVPNVLCSVVKARSEWDVSSHTGSELERTSEDLVAMLAASSKTSDGIDALLAVVQDPASFASTSPASNSRVASAALAALAQLLSLSGRAGIEIPPSQAQRLGAVAVRFLGDSDPDVRRADMEFCLELHARLGGPGSHEGPGSGDVGGFWKTIMDGGLRPEQQNLITYYLARRART